MRRPVSGPAYWVLTFGDDHWSALEQAGKITLPSELRDKLQNAVRRYQDVTEGWAWVKDSDVRDRLQTIGRACRKAANEIEGLRNIPHNNEYGGAKMLMQEVGNRDTDVSFSPLITHLNLLACQAEAALQRVPASRRGRDREHGIVHLLTIAAEVFKAAGGAKAHGVKFRKALAELVGYKGETYAPEGFRRKHRLVKKKADKSIGK
jgi:hypothetical protein